MGLRHLDAVHCGGVVASPERLWAALMLLRLTDSLWTEMAGPCRNYGSSSVPCSLGASTQVPRRGGFRAITVTRQLDRPVLFWNIMSTSVWWLRWGVWFLCRLDSGFWMAISGHVDAGYPVELVTETGAISLRPRVSTRAAGCCMKGRRLASSSSPGRSAALSVDMQLVLRG